MAKKIAQQSVGGGFLGGSDGFVIYDTAQAGILGPTVVNSYTTLSIPAYWRAINFISHNMASFARTVRREGVDVPHRLTPMLQRRPNGYQGSTNFWRSLWMQLPHYGNTFVEIQRDQNYNPIALHNHRPELVQPFRWMTDTGEIQSYFHVGGKTPKILPFSDCIHLAGTSYDGFAGFNPVFLLWEAFERARTVDRYMTRYLVKGTVMRGSIEIPAGASPEQQEAIVDTIREHFTGADAERDVIVLSDGAKLNNSTLSPQESQLLEQAAYTTKQIAQITGVHPHFLFDDSEGKYNANPQQASEDAVRYLFRPLIEQAEDELSNKLLTEAELQAGYRIFIDPDALIRGDTAAVSAQAIAQKAAGIITQNESRLELGYPKVKDPEADKLRTLGDSTPAAAQAQAQPPPVKNSGDAPARQPFALDTFAPLLQDVASRVGTKTDKAIAHAQNKFTADPQGWVVWGNVFSGEQARFAATALEPILATMQATGATIDPSTAQRVGDRYAQSLRQHFAKIGRGEPSTAPDLEQIVQHFLKEDHEQE